MGIFFDMNGLQCINERSIISVPKGKISIHVTPDMGRNLGENEGYFKVCPGDKFDKRNVARIRFKEASYVYHTKTIRKLESYQKKEMIKVLQSNISKSHYNALPVELRDIVTTEWGYLIYRYNADCDVPPQDMLDHLDLNEKFEDIDERIRTKLVRLTLPMPDYTKLETASIHERLDK